MTRRLLTNRVVVDDGKNTVMEMPYSRANLAALYNRCRKYRTLFNQEIREDIGVFASIFLDQHSEDLFDARGIVWVINDLDGMMYMTNIGTDQAIVHFALFKKQLRENYDLGRKMVKYVFNHYGFQRIGAEVPVYVQPWVFTYVKNLGFIDEGNRRRSVRFDSKYFDMRLFGILKTEVV